MLNASRFIYRCGKNNAQEAREDVYNSYSTSPFFTVENPSAAERLITVQEQHAMGAAERAKDARKFSHGAIVIPHTADGVETAGPGDKKAGEEAG